MTDKNRFVNLIKKEYLIFKKLRENSHDIFKKNLSILDVSEFEFIDSDQLLTIYLKIVSYGIGSCLNSNFKIYEEVEFNKAACKCLKSIKTQDSWGNDWLYIFPSEWQLCGGMIISKKAFFSNFLELSFFMEDDFDIYDYSLDNLLKCRGDRSGEDLVVCEAITRGTYFSFFTKFVGS